jgi:hypothetical protein
MGEDHFTATPSESIGYVDKPFSKEELKSEIERLIS